MPYDWSKISPLNPSLATTGTDVVISGHGSYEFNGETQVPAGFELWVMAPPGGSISDPLGGALEHGDTITKIAVASQQSATLNAVPITKYAAGKAAPNYVLHAPRNLNLRPGGPHVIGVEENTKLSDLWTRVQTFARPQQTTRVFWAACSAIAGAKNQVVVHC